MRREIKERMQVSFLDKTSMGAVSSLLKIKTRAAKEDDETWIHLKTLVRGFNENVFGVFGSPSSRATSRSTELDQPSTGLDQLIHEILRKAEEVRDDIPEPLSSTASDSVDDEIDQYKRFRKRTTEAADLEMSAISWWHERGHRFPLLKSFALTILCVPPSIGDVEQAFSGAGLISTRRRARLHGFTLSRLTFLRLNGIVTQDPAQHTIIHDESDDGDDAQ